MEIGTSIDQKGELDGKRFDRIVTAGTSVDERFVTAPLFADRMVFVMPADHPSLFVFLIARRKLP